MKKFLLIVGLLLGATFAEAQTETPKQLFDSCVHNYVMLRILLNDPYYTIEQFRIANARYSKYRQMALSQLHTEKAKNEYCARILAESKKYYK